MMTEAVAVGAPVSVLDAYVANDDMLGGQASYRRLRVRVARAFCDDHPDLDSWMARPLEGRLVELAERPLVWSLIAFAMVSTRCQGDIELLMAKNFGHSMGRWVAALYPDECGALHAGAARIGISATRADGLIAEGLALVISFCGHPPSRITAADLDAVDTAITTVSARPSEAIRRRRRSWLFGLRKLLFEAGLVDCPPAQRREGGPQTRQGRLAVVAAPEIRETLLAYLDARATVLRPKSIAKITSALGVFGEFLTTEFPELTSTAGLQRHHIEAFLGWSATRSCRGNHGSRPVGPFVVAHAALTVGGFLDDITEWGWPQAPPRRLVFPSDIAKQPQLLPRALPPETDAALMVAVADLDDSFARVGLTILRGTGLRVGELLDLEVDCVVDYGPAGSWLRVPLGKLNNERAVPLDAAVLAAFDEWFAQRNSQRAVPHPRTARPTEFVFVANGRRLTAARLQRGLRDATAAAGLTGPDGQPLKIVAHQLRHTYATSLVNAGMSLQALMTLLGHRSPEMTMRYAKLASPTLRAAYDEAVGKIRQRIPVASIGRPAIPDRVEWLNSEMIKTRVAHGYCTRDLAAQACHYANICENCSNFVTTTEFAPVVDAQLADIRHLRDDAEARGWASETARHDRVIDSLEGHLHRLETRQSSRDNP